MARWSIPPDLHHETVSGPLCFFREHSIGSRDGRVPRYSDSHACVRCIASLTEGRLSLDIHKIHRKYRRRFLEFWSFVNITDPDQCWSWHGNMHTKVNSSYFPMPRHWCSGRQFAAPRIATWFTWGDIGRLPIKAVCEDNNCCNPLHIRIQGVPHYYHNRKLQLIDLEFNSRKLIGETGWFLETLKAEDPLRFEKMEATNRRWLELRMQQCSPVQPSMLQDQAPPLEQDGI